MIAHHPNRRGVLTTEYAVIVAAAVSAILVMAMYMRRAIAGGIRKSADAIGEQYAPGEVDAFSETTTSGKNIVTSQSSRQQVDGRNMVTSTTTTNIPAQVPEVTTTTSQETIGPLGSDLWN